MTEPIARPDGDGQHPRAYIVLFASTFAFMVCFAAWMLFGVIGIPIRRALGLNNTEFGLLTATPVLLGAVMRVPLGIWTDRFGGRVVMTLLLLVAAPPVYVLSFATAYWQFLTIGFVLGIVGASFAVGTPYCARFFPRSKRGFATVTYLFRPAQIVRSRGRNPRGLPPVSSGDVSPRS